MRLLTSSKLTLHEFFGSKVPKYAILSHRWENEEVTFQDMRDGKGPGMAGGRRLLAVVLRLFWMDGNML